MALDLTKLDPTGSGSKGAIKIITYGPVSDTLATIEGASYFADVASVFKTGDIMWVDATDGDAFYRLTVSGTTVTLTGLVDSANLTQDLFVQDIGGTLGASYRLPYGGTITTFRGVLANILTSGPTGATVQLYYNSTAIATASVLFSSAATAYTVSSVSGLSQAVTAGGVISVVSDGGPTGGAAGGGAIPATFSFTMRRS